MLPHVKLCFLVYYKITEYDSKMEDIIEHYSGNILNSGIIFSTQV
ncbi:hypothetical protein L21SP2_0153 [Salinispira pacifica]|uniref:Uncharacterized protein n=1 Tax=Salinispira pacifica TaxID=1307761 RepID=V5WCU1_9SPIO|nr:hypothetical protein L21SP2_0153 [Salinispira pacifica]